MKKLILLLAFFYVNAYADIYDLPEPELIMSRKYEVKSELTVNLGYLPVGAFSKFVLGGASYTKYFNDNQAWELLNVLGAAELSSGLKKELLDSYGADPETFPVLKFVATTNYVLSPFYTKSLLFNSSVVYSQLGFALGAGFAQFSIDPAPVIDFGIIQRFYWGENHSLKIDIRSYTYLSGRSEIQETVRNHIYVIMGYSFFFGGNVGAKL